MRDKSLVLLLLLSLMAWPSGLRAGNESHDGLTLTLPQDSSPRAVLSMYTGLDLLVIDTLERDNAGCFRYALILPKGMYIIDNENITIEFLSIGRPVEMFLDDLEDPYAVRFVDSPENERWMAYQKLRDAYFGGKVEWSEARRQVDSLAREGDDYASRLIRVDSNPELKAEDFQDPEIIPTNVLTTKIVHYLEHTDDFITGSDHILGLAKTDLRGYAFALQYLLKGFESMGLSEVTEHLLNFPQLGEGEITEEEGHWLQELTEPYQKVRVGAKAPNYQGVTVDDKSYDLYSSPAKRILVVFWSVDCDYCHEFMVQARKHLDFDRDYELVTFALAEEEREVKKELRKLRLHGYHFFDEARWDGEAFLNYHVVSTPAVFLLDQDKVIVGKPYDWDELENIIKNLEL